jgi:hypothetical protein
MPIFAPFGFIVDGPFRVPYLLDLQVDADIAFSLRKLRSAYTGFAIQVTRSSDNTTQDIGFTDNYSLDTEALLSFVGASNGSVSIWYDQSGNGFNVSEGTVANQPLIVESGVLVTRAGLPALRFIRANVSRISRTTASDILRNSSGIGYFNVSECTGLSTNAHTIVNVRQSGTGTRASMSMRQTATNTGIAFGGRRVNTDAFSSVGAGNVFTNNRVIGATVGDYVAQDMFLYQNGNAFGQNLSFATSGNTGDTQQQLYIGNFNLSTDLYDGYISEILLWPTDKSSVRTQIENNINAYYQVYVDPDAAAFLAAANISDSTTTTAINNLVLDLKNAGLWTKLKALYPFVGGTATTHKWNLKDPRDLDAAFRLTFSGTVTQDSNGVTGNGTDGYYNTYINPSVNMSQNDVSGFVYSRTNSTNVDFGAFNSAGGGFQLSGRNASNQFVTRCMSSSAGISTAPASTDSVGFWTISRTSSANYVKSKNKTHTTITNTSVAPPNFNMFGLCFNVDGSPTAYTSRNQALVGFASGLTTAEIDDLVDINETFQTTLGRFV